MLDKITVLRAHDDVCGGLDWVYEEWDSKGAGLGAGGWIGYMKNGILKERDLDWIEPMAELTTDGKVLCEIGED